jgi:hypothetical protein
MFDTLKLRVKQENVRNAEPSDFLTESLRKKIDFGSIRDTEAVEVLSKDGWRLVGAVPKFNCLYYDVELWLIREVDEASGKTRLLAS